MDDDERDDDVNYDDSDDEGSTAAPGLVRDPSSKANELLEDGDSLPVDDIDGELNLASVRVREVLADGPISEEEKQGVGATKRAMHKVKGGEEDGGTFDLKPWR